MNLGPLTINFARRPDRNLRDEVSSTNPLQSDKFTLPKYNPDSLVGKKGLAAYTDMMTDDGVRPILRAKQFDVVSAGWEIVPASDDDRDVEIGEFVAWNLKRLKGSFASDLLEILSALQYGFSITEKVYEPVTTGRWTGKIRLARLGTRSPEGWDFDTDAHGNLAADGLIQQALGNEQRFDPAKFIVYSYQKCFDNYYGESDLRAAYEAWYQKKLISKFWGMYCERFGLPTVQGTYPSGTEKAKQDDLYDIIKSIQADTAYILPDDLEIEFREVATGGYVVFEKAMTKREQQIARALMYPEQLGLTPREDKGSRALGDVHARGFQPSVAIIVIILEDDVIGDQLIEPLVDLNYDNVENYPTIQFLPLAQDDETPKAQMWLDGVKSGAIPKTTEGQLHYLRVIGFPEAGVEEATTEPPSAPRTGEPGEDDGEPASIREIIDGIKATPGIQVVGTSGTARGGEFTHTPAHPHTRTPAHPWETRVDFTAMARELDARENTAAVDLARVLQKLQGKLLASIERKQLTLNQDMAGVRKLQVPEKGALKAALADLMLPGYKDGRASAQGELKQAFQYTHKGNCKLQIANSQLEMDGLEIVTYAQIQAVIPLPPEKAIQFLNQKAFWMTGVEQAHILKEVQAILLQAMRSGERWQETKAKLEQWFDDGYHAGEVLSSGVVQPGRIATVVRTNLTDAFAQGRKDEIREAAEQAGGDFVRGMAYSAILDDRTTDICQSLDGKVFRLDDPDLDRYTPPNHFNCRSTWIPVLEDDRFEYISGTEKGRAADLVPTSFGGNEQ